MRYIRGNDSSPNLDSLRASDMKIQTEYASCVFFREYDPEKGGVGNGTTD